MAQFYRPYHFLTVLCSRHLTPFPRYFDSAVYATACVIEKSFRLDKTVEIASHVRFPFMYSFRSMGDRNVLYNKSDLQGHSSVSVLVPFDRTHMISY